MKKVLGTALTFFLIGGLCATAAAQQRQPTRGPLLTAGTQEIGLQGAFTFDDEQGSFAMDIAGSYGFFMVDNLQIGGKAAYSRRQGGDLEQVSLGAFGELHFPLAGMTVPYLGLDLDWRYTDLPVGSESSAVASPVVGVKWFVREYFAIDTSLFYSIATDDIFVRDGSPEDTDWGGTVGLRVLFR
jgi:hypothetical protein